MPPPPTRPPQPTPPHIPHNKTVLKAAPDEVEAQAAKTLAALYAEDYTLALAAALPGQELERAYALYRLNQNNEAMVVLQASKHKDEEAYRHLTGQVLFKAGRYDEAAEAFTALAVSLGEEDGDRNAELMTNVYAAYLAAKRGKEALDRFPLDEHLMEACYELVLNTGMALVDAGDLPAAEARLREAQAVCARLGEEDGLSPAEVANESSAIQLELAFVLASRGKRGEAFELVTALMNKGAKLSDPVVRVLAINNAAALREAGKHHKDMSSNLKKLQAAWAEAVPKLMPAQLLLLTLNKALMLLHSGKVSEAKEVLEAAKQEGKGKEGWRVDMVEIAIKMQEDKEGYAPAADLQALLARVQKEKGGEEGEKTVGTVLAQVLVDQGKVKEAAAVLDSLTSLQGYPGHVATLASLFAKLGEEKKSLGVFDQAIAAFSSSSSSSSLPAECKIKVLQGAAAVRAARADHQGAATALRRLLDGEDTSSELDSDARLKALAALVLATSWFDVKEAESLAQSLPMSVSGVGGGEMDATPEALETQGLPRRSSLAVRRSTAVSMGGEKGGGGGVEKKDGAAAPTTSKKKGDADVAAIKQKRAKAKAKHLAKLTAEGKYDANRPPPPPDPERWIATSQRSYNKRGKKGRGKFVGAQGSGDGAQKDTARLDVASRVAAQKAAADGGGLGGTGKTAGGRRKKR